MLELIKVNKSYNNKKILDNINLFIKEGDFYGLIGSNGSGKSTIIKIISGILFRDSGNINIMNLDFDKNKDFIKSKIGLVPQEFNFNPYDTVYNTLYYKLGYLGLDNTDIIDKYLNIFDLNDIKNISINKLSGGNKRKLLILKSIINNPKLLILDEPFVGIDIKFKNYLWNLLKEINIKNNTTIIMITHHIDEIEKLCKNIGILNNGIIKYSISINEFKSKINFKKFDIYISNFNKEIITKLKNFELKIINNNLLNITINNNINLSDVFNIFWKLKIKILNIENKTTDNLDEIISNII